MRIHPFVAAAAFAFAGTSTVFAHLIVEQRSARHRPAAPRPNEPEAPRPLLVPVAAAPAPPRPAPPPEEPPAPTGVLRVRVVGPHGLVLPEADVSATRPGDPEETTFELDEDEDDGAAPGTYVLEELEPGRYDLTVEAPGMRRVTASLSTGDEVHTLELTRAPRLSGALGAAAGVRVVVKGPGADEGIGGISIAEVEGDGAFALDDLPVGNPLTVELHGRDGRPRARALVTLPAEGDPAFLCFAPPCAPASPSVDVYVADDEGRLAGDYSLEWTLLGDDTYGEVGTTTGASGRTSLHGRRAGETLKLVASLDDERRAEATVVVGLGVNDVVLRLPARREEEAAPPPTTRHRLELGEAID
jgi:hypothetical protein